MLKYRVKKSAKKNVSKRYHFVISLQINQPNGVSTISSWNGCLNWHGSRMEAYEFCVQEFKEKIGLPEDAMSVTIFWSLELDDLS